METIVSKKCSKCGVEKPLSDFYARSNHPTGRAPSCKACQEAVSIQYRKNHRDQLRTYQIKYRKNNPEKVRGYSKKYNDNKKPKVKSKKEKERDRQRGILSYGISLQQYNFVLSEQNGVCAICGKSNKSKRLFIDHNHNTGAFRGLLCTRCNAALGLFGDSVEILMKAIAYLSKGVVNFRS